jgi:hypothetical protein
MCRRPSRFTRTRPSEEAVESVDCSGLKTMIAFEHRRSPTPPSHGEHERRCLQPWRILIEIGPLNCWGASDEKTLATWLQSVGSRVQSATADDAETVLTPIEARQGFLGKPVLLVLAFSIVLAVVSLTIILMSAT